jgi:hypothetical protein
MFVITEFDFIGIEEGTRTRLEPGSNPDFYNLLSVHLLFSSPGNLTLHKTVAPNEW